MELSENVKQKLSEAIEAWADENLVGKPFIVANAVFWAMEKELLNQQAKIEETFGRN